jgi:hypothetical protein
MMARGMVCVASCLFNVWSKRWTPDCCFPLSSDLAFVLFINLAPRPLLIALHFLLIKKVVAPLLFVSFSGCILYPWEKLQTVDNRAKRKSTASVKSHQKNVNCEIISCRLKFASSFKSGACFLQLNNEKELEAVLVLLRIWSEIRKKGWHEVQRN